MEKERHASILTVMSAVVKNDSATDVPDPSGEKTDQLKDALTAYLRRGTATIAAEEAFRIGLEIEASEIDVMCSEPLKPGAAANTDARGIWGPATSAQVGRLKAALTEFERAKPGGNDYSRLFCVCEEITMLPDPWIEKAWEIHCQLECLPAGTILKATVWLEERHRETPHWKTAVAIVLHYLVLAIRDKSQAPAYFTQEYLFRAVRWREEVLRCLNESASHDSHGECAAQGV